MILIFDKFLELTLQGKMLKTEILTPLSKLKDDIKLTWNVK